MTAPPPPGWYRDPRRAGYRYWEGQRWSDHILPDGASLPPATDTLRPPRRIPRGTGTRIVLTIAIVVGFVAVAAVVSDVVWLLPIGNKVRRLEVQETIGYGAFVVLVGSVATRVSYRWFDGLIALLPVYGVFWVFRIAWRVSYLPFRDWAPRGGEAVAWQQVAHPSTPGGMLYVVE